MLYPLEKSATEAKIYKIINLNLFSGSSDTFRTAVGGYWEIEETEDASTVVFQEYDKDNPLLKYFHSIGSNTDPEVVSIVSEVSILPNEKIPIRVFGNTEVLNDLHWKRLFLGGSFSGEELKPVYNENVYTYSYFGGMLPYPALDAAKIEGDVVADKIQISYGYNNYLPKYEEYVRNLDSELLIPNFYVLTDLQSYDHEAIAAGLPTNAYDRDVIKYASLEGTYPSLDNLFVYDEVTWPLETAAKTRDFDLQRAKQRTYISTEYLSFELLNSPLSGSTEQAIKNKFKNIILDDVAISKLYKTDKVLQYTDYFPYYVKIDFPFDKNTLLDWGGWSSELVQDTRFTNCIIENNYTARFLKTLKEVFNGDLPHLRPEEVEYAVSTNYNSSSEGDPVNYNINTTENIDLRTVDFVKMLTHTHNNYNSTIDDCYFIGGRNLYRDAAVLDDFGEYRYVNTVATMNTLECIVKEVENEDVFKVSELGDFLYQNEKQSWREVVAYRIQKVGGKPTGDRKEQKTIQNYWLINGAAVPGDAPPRGEVFGVDIGHTPWKVGAAATESNIPTDESVSAGSPLTSLEEFNFIDTQVKYGQNYTYHVYAYVMTVGARYKFSDLRLTKAISVNNYNEEEQTYGLEFYIPGAGRKGKQLYDLETDVGESGFTSLVQEASEFPYLADFYLNYEPCVKITEVPMYSKTLKVLDNPPNETDVSPYQHMDASQQVGFELLYDTYVNFKTFPKVISSADQQLKEDYMNARDLLEGDALPFESVSRPRYIEVYRIDIRPTSYVNFDNKKVGILDLRSDDLKDSYTTDFFDDKILTNKKYYYIFRILNDQRIVGHTSEIYETELINDGGYLYALFNVLHEEDLQEEIFTNPSKNFKKLLHLQPNISQLNLNTTNADFNEEALTQVDNVFVGSADDLIWGKKFKIRLTSEKTGRKIDLNITYNLISQ